MVSTEVASMRGTWKLPNSSVVVEISLSDGELQVRASDRDDGEVLQVEDLEIGTDHISFTLVTPSTRWTVHKEIEPQENGSLRCVTTIIDSWERIS
jgi:hypothetical protein